MLFIRIHIIDPTKCLSDAWCQKLDLNWNGAEDIIRKG
jgi:hypothetical protein